ncbi:MAG: hypothetical protein JW976_15665 [Syntrophaceae bacterium]|nr:hypothetical protein [Syntrophaceae bacterium]
MNKGYVKLWRKSLDAGWIKNHKLWAFWSYCLLKATHKEYNAVIGLQSVHLMPGQFIFGLKKAKEETGLSIRSIRTIIDFLRKVENLTIKTTNKFSIISIVNWPIYQSDNSENDTLNDKPLTNKGQHTRTKEQKNTIYSDDFLKFYSAYPNRKDKQAAYRAWNKLNGTRPPLDVLLTAIEDQKAWRKNANGAFRPEWKHPTTWLNKGSWEDDVTQEQKPSW